MSVVHPVVIQSAVVCVICSLLVFVSDATGDHIDGPLPTTRKQTGHNLRKTQSPLSLRPPTYTLPI